MSRRTVFYGLLDQGVASLTSLLLLAAAAQSLSSEDLGLFSIGMATVISCVAIIRSMTGETLVVRAASVFGGTTSTGTLRQESRNAVGLSLTLGFIASLVIASIGWLWSDVRNVLLCSAITVVAIVGQDCMRHVCITMRKSASLLAGDMLVLVIGVTGIVRAGMEGNGPGPMILLWGLAGFLAFLFIMLIDRNWPSPRGGIEWLRAAWPSSSAFVVEAVLGALIGYAIVVVLGAVGSPADVAGYRATVSIFGVTSLVINFLRTAVLRELTPVHLRDPKNMWRLFSYMAALVAGTTVATLATVLFIPSAWGEAAFGEAWPLIPELAGWATLNRIGAGLSIVPLIFLRAQGVAWSATKIRLKLAAPLVILAPAASAMFGAPGAFIADTVYYVSVTIFLMILSLNGTRSHVKAA